MPVVPDEPARLREDATLPRLDVQGTELHRAGGVEEPAVTRLEDGEAGPPDGRVEAQGRTRVRPCDPGYQIRTRVAGSSHSPSVSPTPNAA